MMAKHKTRVRIKALRCADIPAQEQETEGLLSEIAGGANR